MIACDRFPPYCFDIYREGEVIGTVYIWNAKRAAEVYNKFFGKKTDTIAIPIVRGLPLLPNNLEHREAYDVFQWSNHDQEMSQRE